MRWPFAMRRTVEAEQAANEDLRRRVFLLRDNMKQVVWRVRMNLSQPDNAAAERILTLALVRDLESQDG